MTTPSDTTETQVPASARLRLPRRERSPRSLRYSEAMVLIHRDFLYLRRHLAGSPSVVAEWQALRDAAWAAETATDPAERTAVVDRWRELGESIRSRRGHSLTNRIGIGDVTVDVAAGQHRHSVRARARSVRMARTNTMIAHAILGGALIACWSWPVYLQLSDLEWLLAGSFDDAPERLRTGFSYALWLATVVSIMCAVTVTGFAAMYRWGNRHHRNSSLGSVATTLFIEGLLSMAILITGALFLAVPA